MNKKELTKEGWKVIARTYANNASFLHAEADKYKRRSSTLSFLLYATWGGIFLALVRW